MAAAPIVTAIARNIASKVGIQTDQAARVTDASDVRNAVPVGRHRVAPTKTTRRRRAHR
jgi:hypothetical protein